MRRQIARRLAIPVQDETPRGRVPKLAPNVTHSTAPATWPRLKVKNAAGKQKCVRGDSGGNGGKGDGAEASLERPQLAFPWLSKFSSNLNSRLSFGAEEVQNRTKARDRAEEALQDDKKDPRARARRGGRPSGPQQIWTESDSRRYSIATEVRSNPNSRLNLSNLSKRVTSPNHRSGSDRLREVGQLTSCGGPRCSPLRPTSRREATRASHGRNTGTRASPAPRRGRPTHRGRSVLDVWREESSLL